MAHQKNAAREVGTRQTQPNAPTSAPPPSNHSMCKRVFQTSTVTAKVSNHSGQSFERVEKDGDRDYWMIAEEAKAYGMIDELLVRNNK